MSDYLTTRELAELLRIKERKVYDLAATGQVPCTKALGKLLFPRAAIEAWLASASSPGTAQQLPARPNVFLGSHDPLLDWALRESQCGIATYFDGSTDGINRFLAREGIATGLHIFNPATKTWNTHIAQSTCANLPVIMVEWAVRQRGLMVAPNMAAKIKRLADLKGRTFTPRQTGAGAQLLFEDLIAQERLCQDDIMLTAPARTEAECAMSVLEGKAEAAFGLAGIAAQYKLHYLPLIEERYDIIVDRKSWFEPPMQTLINFCVSPPFTARAKEFSGYDISGWGTVHFNGA